MGGSGRALRDAQVNDDKAVVSLGHPIGSAGKLGGFRNAGVRAVIELAFSILAADFAHLADEIALAE
jgi:hypothetical protein